MTIRSCCRQELNPWGAGWKRFLSLGRCAVVAGKTVEQIRAELEARFKKYISDPVATVIVNGVKGNVVVRQSASHQNPAP